MHNVLSFPYDNTAPLLSHLVCVHVWMRVSGGCILMHALVCCQLAEYRAWRRCCRMTCTDIEMTQTSVITETSVCTQTLTDISFSSVLFFLSDYLYFVCEHTRVFSLACSFHTLFFTFILTSLGFIYVFFL